VIQVHEVNLFAQSELITTCHHILMVNHLHAYVCSVHIQAES